MKVRPIVRRLALAGIVSALAVPITPAPASAAVSCSYDGGSRILDLSVNGVVFVMRGEGGDLGDPVLFGESSPPTQTCRDQNGVIATMGFTSLVRVTGSTGNDSLIVNLTGGLFAPGADPESGQLELEISANLRGGFDDFKIQFPPVGTPVVFGAGTTPLPSARQVAVNLDGDADVTLIGVERFTGQGGAEDNAMTGQGDFGTGAPFPTPLSLIGLGGRDRLVGGNGDDGVAGGAGEDTLDGVDGNDTVSGAEDRDSVTGGPGNDRLSSSSGDDAFFPGPGDDTVTGSAAGSDTIVPTLGPGPVNVDLKANLATGEGTDTLSSIENAVGTDAADTLAGNAVRNSFTGRGGPDLLQGDRENDTLFPGTGADDVRGGADTDTVSYIDSQVGVDVDLSAGTAVAGGETDTIAPNVENASGSLRADELTGTDGPNILNGFGDDDDLFGLGGEDTLNGGTGNDDLDGGAGTDSCQQGDGTGTLTACETVGTSDLKPADATVRVDEPITYTVTWTHPRRWRRLDTVELRVRNGDRIIAWARWNQEGNTFQLFRSEGFGPERPGGSGGTLSSPNALLHLGGSDAVALNPQTIAVTMRLSFLRSAIGEHVVETNAEDDRGNRQGWEQAGTLRVTGA